MKHESPGIDHQFIRDTVRAFMKDQDISYAELGRILAPHRTTTAGQTRKGQEFFNKEYDLRVMPVATLDELPEESEALFVVALVNGRLHIRIFDAIGRRVVDADEAELTGGKELSRLKELLGKIPTPTGLELPEDIKREIIDKATLVTDYSRKENYALKVDELERVANRMGISPKDLLRPSWVNFHQHGPHAQQFIQQGARSTIRIGNTGQVVNEPSPLKDNDEYEEFLEFRKWKRMWQHYAEHTA